LRGRRALKKALQVGNIHAFGELVFAACALSNQRLASCIEVKPVIFSIFITYILFWHSFLKPATDAKTTKLSGC
jgi:low temperature requirement protein LtrA